MSNPAPTTLEELKLNFEANLLDGDEIQEGQMLGRLLEITHLIMTRELM